MTHALVEVRGLVQRYPAVDQAPRDILCGLDLDVEAGESVAIVGPSGCGKSTLLNVIGALLPPTSGTVRFDGRDLADLSEDERAGLRRDEIGYVFQSHHLLPQLSAIENVLVPTLVGGGNRRALAARAASLLGDVGLADRTGHRPAQLSGGECQRVAVVRALINEPRVILADEPTGSLDGEAAEQLATLLCDLQKKASVALLTVTHAPTLAARMQRVLEMRDGKLVGAST